MARTARSLLRAALPRAVPSWALRTWRGLGNAESAFHSHAYLRHNARRLEHLASLDIPVRGSRVLELGAGIGDHSDYFVDRGCDVTITDGRADNVAHLRRRFPGRAVHVVDLDRRPSRVAGAPFDVVHAYGLLYHLREPAEALRFMAEHTSSLLLLETCVSFGSHEAVNPVDEDAGDPTQAVSGGGCRPTRPWLVARLRELFEYVYVPLTQPNHEEFPVDWSAPATHRAALARAVLVASRRALESAHLGRELVDHQTRHA